MENIVNKPKGVSKKTKLQMPSDPLLKPKVTLTKLAKSRTNEFNIVIAPAILSILAVFGVSVPLPVIIGGYAVINFVLRSVTKTAISEK